jgi:hypothetical protein
MAVIAMTREMATLGKDVAAGLADRLGLNIVHHELVEHDIAEHAGMRESEVHRFLEGEASLLERWKIDRKRLSHYTAQEILELAVTHDPKPTFRLPPGSMAHAEALRSQLTPCVADLHY